MTTPKDIAPGMMVVTKPMKVNIANNGFVMCFVESGRQIYVASTDLIPAPVADVEQVASRTAYIDTEFNGFGGELISMAIVMDGVEFYQVKVIPEKLDPWVSENVIPVLGKEPIGAEMFKFSLHTFLSAQKPDRIVADWPSDLEHLFREMMGADHSETLALSFTTVLDPTIAYTSKVPHNALEDARAIAAIKGA